MNLVESPGVGVSRSGACIRRARCVGRSWLGSGGLPGRFRSFAPVAAALALSACAREVASAVEPAAPGFLLGLWHGFIFPFAWVGSLFSPDIAIYAVPNNGGWYDFGYFLGIAVFGIGARKTRIVYKDRVINVRARRIY